MTAGFYCLGDAGNIQISESTVNFTLTGKGIAQFRNNKPINSSIPGSTGNGLLHIDVLGGVAPIIFFRSTDLFITLFRVRRLDSNTVRFSFYGSGGGAIGDNSDVPYYIFDKQPQIETHYGLNVYGPGGELVFSSDYKPMRVVDIVRPVTALDGNVTNLQTQTQIYGGSGIYAAHMAAGGNLGSVGGTGGPPSPRFLSLSHKFNPGGVFATSYILGNGPGSGDDRSTPPGFATIIDVAGL